MSDDDRVAAIELQVRQLSEAIVMLGQAHMSLLGMFVLVCTQRREGETTQ